MTLRPDCQTVSLAVCHKGRITGQLQMSVRMRKQLRQGELGSAELVKLQAMGYQLERLLKGNRMIVIFKAEESGRTMIKVNPSYKSQERSRCGHRNRMALATRVYRCSRRGLVIQRDRNGSKRTE